MARDYDLGIIINPDVGDEQARAIVERVTQSITANDGQVVRVNAVGRRRLAYPIDRHRDGLYFFFDFTIPPEAASELERTLRVNESIIRHLMLVRDPRFVAQQRQREAEAEAQAQQRAAEVQAAQAQAQAQAQAAQAAQAQVAQAPEAETQAEPVVEAPEEAEQAEADTTPVASEAEANA
ncbi:MAG TPA: 30S ribosomal protein S6 [Ktedonobacterales bacterium]